MSAAETLEQRPPAADGAAPPDGTEPAGRPRSLWSDAWRDLRRNPVFLLSALIIVFLVVISLWPSLIASGNPLKCDLAKAQEGAQPGHPFGYDGQGCDVYTRTVYGARVSIAVGVCATLGVALLGSVLGGLAGFFGGYSDSFLSRITDVFFAIPVVLGGDHSVTYPDAKGVANVLGHGRVSMIHFDAHADTGDIEFGSLWGHGQPMRRLIESGAVRGDRFLQIGLRGYWPGPETLSWMAERRMRSYEMTEIVARGLDDCLTEAFTTAGVATTFDVGGNPQGIAAGPQGQVLYTNPEGGANHAARLVLGGTPQKTPLPNTDPSFSVAYAPDDAYWVGLFLTRQVARITPAGTLTTYGTFPAPYLPRYVANGPKGTIWLSLQDPGQDGAIGRVTGSETAYVPGCGTRTVVLPTPDGPWRAELAIETFVPQKVDPEHSSDARALGAQVGFGIQPRG